MTVSGRNKKADPTNMNNLLKQSRRGSSGGGGGTVSVLVKTVVKVNGYF